MECSLVTEPTSNSKLYGGGVAQLDRAQNSKVAIVRCPCRLCRCCILREKHVTLSSKVVAMQLSGYEGKLATARLSTLDSVFEPGNVTLRP